jgi:hypothetical protein
MDYNKYEPKESIQRIVIGMSGKLTVLEIAEVKEMFIPILHSFRIDHGVAMPKVAICHDKFSTFINGKERIYVREGDYAYEIDNTGVKINNSNTLDMRTFKGVIYYNVTV